MSVPAGLTTSSMSTGIEMISEVVEVSRVDPRRMFVFVKEPEPRNPTEEELKKMETLRRLKEIQTKLKELYARRNNKSEEEIRLYAATSSSNQVSRSETSVNLAAVNEELNSISKQIQSLEEEADVINSSASSLYRYSFGVLGAIKV